MTAYTCAESPVGPLLLASDGTSLTGLYLAPSSPIDPRWVRRDDAPLFANTRRQLAAYFEGRLKEFDLPLAPHGTLFQTRVWEELNKIPYGVTLSYGDVARRIGDPNASRAVGLANGRNPIAIIVACHRVIGANGQLTGYGGGLSRKAALLAFEASVLAGGPRRFPRSTEEGNLEVR